MIGKTFYFRKIVRNDDVTPFQKLKKKHASELWSIMALLVDLAYFKELVENAYLVVSLTQKKCHFHQS